MSDKTVWQASVIQLDIPRINSGNIFRINTDRCTVISFGHQPIVLFRNDRILTDGVHTGRNAPCLLAGAVLYLYGDRIEQAAMQKTLCFTAA